MVICTLYVHITMANFSTQFRHENSDDGDEGHVDGDDDNVDGDDDNGGDDNGDDDGDEGGDGDVDDQKGQFAWVPD